MISANECRIVLRVNAYRGELRQIVRLLGGFRRQECTAGGTPPASTRSTSDLGNRVGVIAEIVFDMGSAVSNVVCPQMVRLFFK